MLPLLLIMTANQRDQNTFNSSIWEAEAGQPEPHTEKPVSEKPKNNNNKKNPPKPKTNKQTKSNPLIRSQMRPFKFRHGYLIEYLTDIQKS